MSSSDLRTIGGASRQFVPGIFESSSLRPEPGLTTQVLPVQFPPMNTAMMSLFHGSQPQRCGPAGVRPENSTRRGLAKVLRIAAQCYLGAAHQFMIGEYFG
jgi:hypothetical protein